MNTFFMKTRFSLALQNMEKSNNFSSRGKSRNLKILVENNEILGQSGRIISENKNFLSQSKYKKSFFLLIFF